MQRDGALASLWQYNRPDYTPALNNNRPELYDVLIVGGGITGISTAIQLQRYGLACMVAEAHTLGFGTTGGTTAHLNTILDTSYADIESKFSKEDAALIAAATKKAIALITENVQQYNISCQLESREAFLLAQDDEQEKELEKIIEASQRAGIDLDYVSQIPLPLPFVRAARVGGQAQFNPMAYVYGIANAFETAGGIIEQHCRVEMVEEKTNELLEVTTNRGVIQCRKIVYATHIPPGVNLLHFRCAPYRSYAIAIELAEDLYPDALLYDMADPYHYFRSHEVEGRKYLIVGGNDHKTGHETDATVQLNDLTNYVAQYLPVSRVSHSWSSQYYQPVDGLPYIGNLPGHDERYFVATGFSGNGMTYGSLAAYILAEMIVHENIQHPLVELLDPNRIKPVAGFAKIVKENIDVVGEWIGGRLNNDSITSFEELAPGEGKVISYKGEPIAVYKDVMGNIHAVNAVCKHMKCTVKWNNAEMSWDCPCHGARYSMDGNVLTGPAARNLEYVNVQAKSTV